MLLGLPGEISSLPSRCVCNQPRSLVRAVSNSLRDSTLVAQHEDGTLRVSK